MKPAIGLEIHVQLATKSKLFCSCAVESLALENIHCCPVCLGYPGALPVTNQKAVDLAAVLGCALGCSIAEKSFFARKHYTYPDLPKSYQISQYAYPIAFSGRFHHIDIERAHLEEDAAKLVHTSTSGRLHDAKSSRIDFNRGGMPLVEIVTLPQFTCSEEVGIWLRLLHATVEETGVSRAVMAEGHMRIDANVSLTNADGSLGTKTELKNMNSIRFIERGIDAEIRRQRSIIESGDQVRQATMHYDTSKDHTTPTRFKEEAAEYRYLEGDPDLAPLHPAAVVINTAELPAARYQRFSELAVTHIDALRIARSRALSSRFDSLCEAMSPARALVHLDTPWAVDQVLIAEALIASREATSDTVHQLLAKASVEGICVLTDYKAPNLDLDTIIASVIEADEDNASQVRAGKQGAVAPLVGAVMRQARGADGKRVRELLLQALS